MLNDILTNLTDNFHDSLGHLGTDVDSMMDSASGMGHRIEHGHDLQGAIEAYQLEGIEGIGYWFDHMLKDFTTDHGIPLPFAEAIEEAGIMGTEETIDWLTINAADVIELGGQAALLKYFKKNKKQYAAAISVGTAFGFIEDNPLIIAYNAIHLLQMYEKSGKEIPLLDHSLHFLNRGFAITSKVCIGIAVLDIGLASIGINLAEVIENSDFLLDGMDVAIEGATVAADVIDGAATLGLGLLASYGVKKAAKMINGSLEQEYFHLLQKQHTLKSLYTCLKIGMPISVMMMILKYSKDLGWFDGPALEG